jgi:hypothetical protein
MIIPVDGMELEIDPGFCMSYGRSIEDGEIDIYYRWDALSEDIQQLLTMIHQRASCTVLLHKILVWLQEHKEAA